MVNRLNCSNCFNVLLSTVYRLSCNLCKNTYHTQCTNVSKNNVRTMTDSIKTLWICHHCVAIFPFNHIVDDEEFVKSCSNDNGVTKRLCHELLFNPFDTISHDILLRKLYNYGIRGIALDLIADYLTGRSQYVSYNNCNSATLNTSIGIPQGSILGPLLFILYVNDLNYVSPNLSCIQFADDTNIFSSGSSLDDIFNVLNCELESISTWLRANELVLNVSKSNYMIMTSPRTKILTNHYTLCIDGHVIQGVSEYKFLGVVIDAIQLQKE